MWAGPFPFVFFFLGPFPSVQFSCLVVSDSLQPRGLQHARLPCPPPTPRSCSHSCPSSQWCHPTISTSVFPFSSCLQSFPASGSFPRNQFSTSGGQSIGVSASASVLPMNIQDRFPLGLTGWISLLSKGLSRVFSNATVQNHPFPYCFWISSQIILEVWKQSELSPAGILLNLDLIIILTRHQRLRKVNTLKPHWFQSSKNAGGAISISPSKNIHRTCNSSYNGAHHSRRRASQVVLVGKNPPANVEAARDLGSISGSGRSPGGGHGNLLHYSCLGNSMDRGAWWAKVDGANGESDAAERLSTPEVKIWY